jgi:hypothetical protein
VKSTLHRIEIAPSSNGGFTVTHHMKPLATHSKGTAFGGLGMHTAEPKTHTFGPKDHHALTAHLAKALGLANAKEEQGESKAFEAGEKEPEE